MNSTLIKFKQSINNDEVTISKAKESNAQVQQWEKEYSDLKDNLEGMQKVLGELKELKKYIIIAMNKYKSTTEDILRQDIENALELEFPDEHFRVKIENTPSGNGECNSFLLIGKKAVDDCKDQDDDGYVWQTPQVQNGGLCKQVIAFASQASILQMLGSNTFLLDEAFANGDPISLAELSPYFMKLYSAGFQILGIEHKGEVYSNLPHKEYKMIKDRINDKIVIESVEDLGQIDMSTISNLIGADLNAAMISLQGMTDNILSEIKDEMAICKGSSRCEDAGNAGLIDTEDIARLEQQLQEPSTRSQEPSTRLQEPSTKSLERLRNLERLLHSSQKDATIDSLNL